MFLRISLLPSEKVSNTEAEARCWGKEQAYLADLTKLYHLEQYPDSYDSMCEWASYSGQVEVVGALGQYP